MMRTFESWFQNSNEYEKLLKKNLIIGTNKSDAAAVIELLVSDLKSPKNAGDVSELLTHQVVVSQQHWQKINEAEIAAGEPKGKPRVKSVKRKELLKQAGL